MKKDPKFFLKHRLDKTWLANCWRSGLYAWLWGFGCCFSVSFLLAEDWGQVFTHDWQSLPNWAAAPAQGQSFMVQMTAILRTYSLWRFSLFAWNLWNSLESNYGRIAPLVTKKSPFPSSAFQTFCSNAASSTYIVLSVVSPNVKWVLYPYSQSINLYQIWWSRDVPLP